MAKIAIFSDAHLLMQAEWLDDESQLTAEGNEVLNNFERAIDDIRKEKPDAVLMHACN
jgi:DNA repair exonuclease SbcCD nuclease subunit